jgi:hypothetical protein
VRLVTAVVRSTTELQRVDAASASDHTSNTNEVSVNMSTLLTRLQQSSKLPCLWQMSCIMHCQSRQAIPPATENHAVVPHHSRHSHIKVKPHPISHRHQGKPEGRLARPVVMLVLPWGSQDTPHSSQPSCHCSLLFSRSSGGTCLQQHWNRAQGVESQSQDNKTACL